MSASEKIKNQSDSLIRLLTAQCADLETLLVLAREETVAAERLDFDEILRIVRRRDEIGARLETFQRQIGELRSFLSSNETDNAKHRKCAGRVIEIANLTLAQDGKTKLLLAAARENAAEEMQTSEKNLRLGGAYLRGCQKGLAYSRSF